MIVNIYLLGSMITMVAAALIGHSGKLWVTLLAALVAAALWPVLLIGGIQLVALGLFTEQQKHQHAGAFAAAGHPRHRLIHP